MRVAKRSEFVVVKRSSLSQNVEHASGLGERESERRRDVQSGAISFVGGRASYARFACYVMKK